MKVDKIAPRAKKLYEGGMSVEAVAEALECNYRTARKALWHAGVEFRDPSARLLGRTRPDKRTAAVK
jgi:hypothetical protein